MIVTWKGNIITVKLLSNYNFSKFIQLYTIILGKLIKLS